MLTLESLAFNNNTPIPYVYTCEGKNVSPQMMWTGGKEGAVSYTIICDDPDAPDPKAPKMVFVHWVLYNIPKGTKVLPEGYQGAVKGKNGWGTLGYRGPCPPIGEHRYFFKLYALDTVLDLKEGATKDEVMAKMRGHIIEQAELVGLYEKGSRG